MTDLQTAPSIPRFDWYGATLQGASPDHVIELLSGVLGAELRASKPINGYRDAIEFRSGDRRIGMVMWGGRNPDPYAVASGQDAEPFAAAIRSLDLPHRVSRADVCIDVDAPNAFELLSAELRARALKSGLALELWQDPERPERGRTLYVGSRKSRGFVRLYEKGRKDDPTRPNWVRFEVELKPEETTQKSHLASIAPMDALGMVRWVKSFVADQFDFAAAAAPVRLENIGDDERSMQVLLKQWGPLLLREYGRAGGSWESFGVAIGRRLNGL